MKLPNGNTAECPDCDGIHDHQIGWIKGLKCPKCGLMMVESLRIPK